MVVFQDARGTHGRDFREQGMDGGAFAKSRQRQINSENGSGPC
jgi:hypothetical protein